MPGRDPDAGRPAGPASASRPAAPPLRVSGAVKRHRGRTVLPGIDLVVAGDLPARRGLGSSGAFLTAIVNLPLANTSAIFQALPLAVAAPTLLAALREHGSLAAAVRGPCGRTPSRSFSGERSVSNHCVALDGADTFELTMAR